MRTRATAIKLAWSRPDSTHVLHVAAWCAAAVVVGVLFAFASLHTVTISPDGSTVLLEGSSLNSGNLALRGWSLSLDSFWTVDAPLYAVGVRLLGVTPALLTLVPAAIGVLVVGAVATIAAEGQRGYARLAAVATVAMLLAVPSPDLVDYLLQGPWHVATALWCLIAFACVAPGRFGWRWVVAVVFLAAGLLGDLMTLSFGVAPVLLVGIVSIRRVRSVRAGLAGISAAAASVLLALAVRLITSQVGTFSLVNRNVPIRAARVVANLKRVPSRMGGLFGVGNLKIKGVTNGARVFQALHVVAVAGIVVAVIAAVVGLALGLARPVGAGGRRGATSTLDDLLVVALLATVATFVVASQSGNLEFTKYLTPGVVFAVALAGRAAGRVVSGTRSRRWKECAAIAGSVLSIGFAIEFCVQLSHPVPNRPAAALGRFLEAHQLRNGVGDYWSSSLVTVETDAAVTVRPVSTNTKGKIVRFDRQSDVDWYRGESFAFLVFDTARPWHGVNATSAAATYGEPGHEYAVGTYRVLVWPKPVRVAATQPSTGPPLRIFWSTGRPEVDGAGR